MAVATVDSIERRTHAATVPARMVKASTRPLRELQQRGAARAVDDALRSNGQNLDRRTRTDMEARIGHDFSNVRIHTGATAAGAARLLGAVAFTFGRDVVFGEGRYMPHTRQGRSLILHELGHVAQAGTLSAAKPIRLDGGPADPVERDTRRAAEDLTRAPSADTGSPRGARADPGTIYRQTEEPDEDDWWDWLDFRRKRPLGKGGDFGGGGAGGDFGDAHTPSRCPGHGCHDYLDPPRPKLPPWFPPTTSSPAPAPGVFAPQPPPPSVPATNRLQFFHGTRWSVAKQIPKNVKPIGGGDFAAGFYTHFDEDTEKARARAVKWGRILARKKPPEQYAGVVRFGVPEPEYRKLFAGDKGTRFALTRTDQPDYAERQKQWLDFVTSKGREAEPRHRVRKGRGEWVHKRRPVQPDAEKNVIVGPFYQPVPGKKGAKPPRTEFKPYAEGAALPQQVLWAHDGIDLLNSNKTQTELTKYERDTGKRVDPKVDDASTVAVPPDADLKEAAEEAQFAMGD